MGTHSPDLRVSHEPIAKADREPVCVEGAVAVVLRNSIHVGGVACLDRVALHALLWGDAPSIVDAVWEGGTVSEVEVCGEMECDLHEADLVLDLDHGEKEGAGGRTKGGWGGSSVSSIGRGRLSCCFSRDRPSVMGVYLIQWPRSNLESDHSSLLPQGHHGPYLFMTLRSRPGYALANIFRS